MHKSIIITFIYMQLIQTASLTLEKPIQDVECNVNLAPVYHHIMNLTQQFCPPTPCQMQYIHSVKVTPNGKICIADRSTLYMYDTVQQKVLIPQLDIATTIESVTWSQDETKLYLHTPFKIYSYDINTHQTTLHFFSLNHGPIKKICFNSDCSKVLITFDSKSLLYDMVKEETDYFFPEHALCDAYFKNNDTQLLIRTENHDVIVCDLINHTHTIYSFNDRDCNCIAADISSDGKQLLMAGEAKFMIINLITGQKEFEHIYEDDYFYRHNAAYAHFSSDDKQTIVLYHVRNSIIIFIYDRETHHITTTSYEARSAAPEHDTLITKLVYDNSQLICVKRRYAECYNIYNGKLLWKTHFICNSEGDSAYVYHAAISDDGSQLAVIPGLFVPEAYLFKLINLEELNLHQKLLCLKACHAWQQQQPYLLLPEEVEIYQSLPNSLQTAKFFLIKEE